MIYMRGVFSRAFFYFMRRTPAKVGSASDSVILPMDLNHVSCSLYVASDRWR